MVDTLTPEQRKKCMSSVRNKNTDIEFKLRKSLWKAGLRYRLNFKLPGKPDIVFPRKKVAIFVDGCFWHGCPDHGTNPETNSRFWQNKIKNNIERDKIITNQLTEDGWVVIRIWEHDIKASLDAVVLNVTKTLCLRV